MSLRSFLETGWMRGWMESLLVFLGTFLLLYIWSGDFDPLQSHEAAAALWKLRCGAGDASGAQGGLLHLVASTFGFHSVAVAAGFLQLWCFASVATMFWVGYRLAKVNGIEGPRMLFLIALMFFSMRGMLQWADFGHSSVVDFSLFALAFLLYFQGRIHLFWVVFAVLLVQSVLALPLIVAVIVHQSVSPGFFRQFGGFISMFPIFAGLPLAFLMVWEHLVTGDTNVLHWAFMGDPLLMAGGAWNDKHLWADPELLVPVAGLTVLLAFAVFMRRLSALRNKQFVLPSVVAATMILMASWGWVESAWMIMLVKWMAWFLLIIAGVGLWEAWSWGMGAALFVLLAGFFLPFNGVALTQKDREAVKRQAATSVSFSATVLRESEEDDVWLSLAGLPASHLGCECHLLGPESPADDVLAKVRIYNPDAAILPGYDVFRDSMEAVGYERRLDFWAPVLEGDMPWVYWKKRKAGHVFSRPVSDSAIHGEGLHHLPGLSLNRYFGSNSLEISLKDSSAQALRFGFFGTRAVWESAQLLISVGDSASRVLPMQMFAGRSGMPPGIVTVMVELPGSIRRERRLRFENPDGGGFLFLNIEAVSYTEQ